MLREKNIHIDSKKENIKLIKKTKRLAEDKKKYNIKCYVYIAKNIQKRHKNNKK